MPAFLFLAAHKCRFSAFLDEAESALRGDEGPFLYLAQHPLQEGETMRGQTLMSDGALRMVKYYKPNTNSEWPICIPRFFVHSACSTFRHVEPPG